MGNHHPIHSQPASKWLAVSGSRQVEVYLPSLKLTAKAPENGWLEDEFPFGMAQLQGRAVSFRECSFFSRRMIRDFRHKKNKPRCYPQQRLGNNASKENLRARLFPILRAHQWKNNQETTPEVVPEHCPGTLPGTTCPGTFPEPVVRKPPRNLN